MFELFNVNDQQGLTVFEIENAIVDMTQTGDLFDRLVGACMPVSDIYCMQWESYQWRVQQSLKVEVWKNQGNGGKAWLQTVQAFHQDSQDDL